MAEGRSITIPTLSDFDLADAIVRILQDEYGAVVEEVSVEDGTLTTVIRLPLPRSSATKN